MFKRVSREMFGDEVSSADEHFGSATNYRQQAARKAGKQKQKGKQDSSAAAAAAESNSEQESVGDEQTAPANKRAKRDDVLNYFAASDSDASEESDSKPMSSSDASRMMRLIKQFDDTQSDDESESQHDSDAESQSNDSQADSAQAEAEAADAPSDFESESMSESELAALPSTSMQCALCPEKMFVTAEDVTRHLASALHCKRQAKADGVPYVQRKKDDAETKKAADATTDSTKKSKKSDKSAVVAAAAVVASKPAAVANGEPSKRSLKKAGRDARQAERQAKLLAQAQAKAEKRAAMKDDETASSSNRKSNKKQQSNKSKKTQSDAAVESSKLSNKIKERWTDERKEQQDQQTKTPRLKAPKVDKSLKNETAVIAQTPVVMPKADSKPVVESKPATQVKALSAKADAAPVADSSMPKRKRKRTLTSGTDDATTTTTTTMSDASPIAVLDKKQSTNCSASDQSASDATKAAPKQEITESKNKKSKHESIAQSSQSNDESKDESQSAKSRKRPRSRLTVAAQTSVLAHLTLLTLQLLCLFSIASSAATPVSAAEAHGVPGILMPSAALDDPSPPVIRRYQLFPLSTVEGDTQADIYTLQQPPPDDAAPERTPFTYEFCTFTNVIARSDHLIIQFSVKSVFDAYAPVIRQCGGPKRRKGHFFDVCHCFYSEMQAEVQYTGPEPTEVTNRLSLPNKILSPHHYWGVSKWVHHHHIGHWAQKMVLFASVQQHTHHVQLETHPKLWGFLWHDTDSQVQPHEIAIFNISLIAALRTQRHEFVNLLHSSPLEHQLMYSDTLQALQQNDTDLVVGRISFTVPFGIFATNAADTRAFRHASEALFGITTSAQRCPPRKVSLLYRADRGILNKNEVMQYVKDRYKHEVQLVTINGDSTPREQAFAFADSGLLLSSHSSQLINVLFSHPNSVMIEMAPEFYNADFSEYAHGLGVRFQYASGGTVPGKEISSVQRECVDVLDACKGDSHCILHKRFECKPGSFCCKSDNFNANMTSVRRAIDHAFEHLAFVCGQPF